MVDETTFAEWCRNNGGDVHHDHQDHVGDVVECKFSREHTIAWTEEGLDVFNDGTGEQIISEGARLPDGANGNTIVAVDAQDAPDAPTQDFTIEASGSYPNGDFYVR